VVHRRGLADHRPGYSAAGHRARRRSGSDLDADLDGPEPPDLAAWFGDDLTDSALPPAAAPVAVLPPDASVAGVTSLVVACWPLDSSGDAANRVRVAWLLAACARLLRPGGCLVLVVGTPIGRSVTPEDFRPLVAAASAAGLGYLQHIVAVAAETDGDWFTYFATDEELLSLAAGGGGQRWAVAHVRVHADCFVFSQTNTPPRRRRGGDARG
jgi:SAM-dependent methyltransferase